MARLKIKHCVVRLQYKHLDPFTKCTNLCNNNDIKFTIHGIPFSTKCLMLCSN